jgi:hypothetical protein
VLRAQIAVTQWLSAHVRYSSPGASAPIIDSWTVEH